MTKAPSLLKSLLTAAVLLIAPVRARVEPLKIRLAYVVPVTNLASILFAKDAIAKHNGKTYVVDVIRYQASTTQIIALANGELDIALLGFTSLPLAIENAHMDDLRAIVGELQDGAPGYYSNEFAVLVDGPIRKVEDLKGKVLATNAQGSAVDVGMRARLRMSGLEAKRDYTNYRSPVSCHARHARRAQGRSRSQCSALLDASGHAQDRPHPVHPGGWHRRGRAWAVGRARRLHR